MIENLGNNLLKKIPGCENTFVANNGQLREGLNQPQSSLRFGTRSQNQPSLNRPHYSNRNQQPNQYRNCFQPNNPPSLPQHHNQPLQPGYTITQHQTQAHQDHQGQSVFENSDAVMPMNELQHRSSVPISLYPTPPPVAVPQPQTRAAPAPTPLQDLLGRSANVYEQPSGPADTRNLTFTSFNLWIFTMVTQSSLTINSKHRPGRNTTRTRTRLSTPAVMTRPGCD